MVALGTWVCKKGVIRLDPAETLLSLIVSVHHAEKEARAVCSDHCGLEPLSQ